MIDFFYCENIFSAIIYESAFYYELPYRKGDLLFFHLTQLVVALNLYIPIPGITRKKKTTIPEEKFCRSLDI